MTLEAVQTRKISLEEYFEMEYAARERHEFVNGEIRTMPYTTENHQLVVANLLACLVFLLRVKDEKVLANDRLVYAPECNKTYYPVLSIFPGNIEYKVYKVKMKSALNPLVIIEVLSDSTEAIDRGEKFACYKTIPSLKQYVLVSQNEMKVEVFTRQEVHNEWLYKEYNNETETVNIGEILVPIQEIYRKVDFEKVEGERKID